MPQLGAQQVADLVNEYGGAVLVVDGQPGYHARTCQDLPELGVVEIDVLLAREDGFTRCRTCRPDLVLAKRAQLEQAAFQARQDEPSRAAPPALATAEAPRAIVVPTQAHPPVAAPVAPAPLLPMRSEQFAPVGKQLVFDGGAGTYLGTAILAFLVTFFTIGICYPFALVLRERWRAKHSRINGQQLVFTGSATGLFGLWLKWMLLFIVTLGIYSFWISPRMARWKWQHTGFQNQVVVRPAS